MTRLEVGEIYKDTTDGEIVRVISIDEDIEDYKMQVLKRGINTYYHVGDITEYDWDYCSKDKLIRVYYYDSPLYRTLNGDLLNE